MHLQARPDLKMPPDIRWMLLNTGPISHHKPPRPLCCQAHLHRDLDRAAHHLHTSLGGCSRRPMAPQCCWLHVRAGRPLQRAHRQLVVPRSRSTSKGGDTTHMAVPTRQRSARTRMLCSLCVTPARPRRDPLLLLSGPFSARDSVPTSLPDALRAGHGSTANSWNKSHSSLEQALLACGSTAVFVSLRRLQQTVLRWPSTTASH